MDEQRQALTEAGSLSESDCASAWAVYGTQRTCNSPQT